MTNAAREMTVFEPGVSSAYGNGWKQLWKNFLELLLVFIVIVVISLPFSIVTWIVGASIGITIASAFYSILIATPLTLGVTFVFLTAARGEGIQINDMFKGFKRYKDAVITGLLLFLIFSTPSLLLSWLAQSHMLVGGLLSFVWGIITLVILCKLVFTPFLIVDKKMKALDAIRLSWQWTRGYALNVFLLFLLAIPIISAGFVCFVVGVIPAYMWIWMAVASYYHAVDLKKQTVVLPQSPIIGQ